LSPSRDAPPPPPPDASIVPSSCLPAATANQEEQETHSQSFKRTAQPPTGRLASHREEGEEGGGGEEATRKCETLFLLSRPSPLALPIGDENKRPPTGRHHYRVLTHVDQWISRTLNQMSRTKLKSRYKH